MFRWPRCSVISSFEAVSITLLVNCFNSPSGPVLGRALLSGEADQLLRGHPFAEGSGFFFPTASSVVITAPSSQTPRSAHMAGNTFPGQARGGGEAVAGTV